MPRALRSDAGGDSVSEFAVSRAVLRVSLVPDAPSVMVGEPSFVTMVIENVGAEAVTLEYSWMGRNDLGRPSNYSIEAQDAQGAAVPVAPIGPEFGGQSWNVTLDPGQSRRTRMLLSLWTPFERPGRYALALRTTMPARAASMTSAVETALSARANIDVRPENPADFVAMIAALEARALRSDEDAARAIVWIKDPRVIDALVRLASRPLAGETVSYLFALGRFDDERAVAALERSLRVTAADLDPSRYANDSLREQSAQSLRLTSAQALDRCPHARALSVLLSLRQDSNDNVRLTVLHRAARLPRAQSEPVIRAMLSDRYALVRQEAERYLRELR
jgi:hypothetical protein